MKNTPKKVFILENGNYKELSYEDFARLKKTIFLMRTSYLSLCTECLWK